MGLAPQLWTAAEYHEHLLGPVGEVVVGMERTGVPVDLEKLREIEADMGRQADVLRATLTQWTGGKDVNWNSWQQLAAWLHNVPAEGGLGLEPSPYWKKGEVALEEGEIKTDDRALEWLAGHCPEQRAPIMALRRLRQVERMARYARDWLVKALPFGDGTWRLHPSFGLASDHDTRPGAVTGRFGVKNPPLNQVPRDPKKDPAGMRAAFVPPPGCRLVVVDYSQLEVVILGHLIAVLYGADDPLVQKLRLGQDIHGPLARHIFGELAGDKTVAAAPDSDFKIIPALKALRDLAKAGIYGNNYGKGEQGFATSTFLPNGEPLGPHRAHLLVEGLKGLYPGIPRYQEFVRDFITKESMIVTLFGRWQPLPNARAAKQGLRNRAWRQALNYPMQGGGQEIMALALIQIAKDTALKELGYVVALVVHDEIVGWAPEANAEAANARVNELMCGAVELLTPLRAEGHTGETWKSCK